MKLFGFVIRRRDDEKPLPSFAPPDTADGALTVASAPGGGGSYSTFIDLDGAVRTESELVTRYREIALQPEIDAAIDEVVNEIVVDSEDSSKLVELVLDTDAITEGVKKTLLEEFDETLRLLDFSVLAYQTVRRWYIDGRLYYHVMIDEKNPKLGVREVRYIDPRKIRKVREVKKTRVPGTQAVNIQVVNEYYIYNDKGFGKTPQTLYSTQGIEGIQIAKDSIVHVPSGLPNQNGSMVLSYLHKAIKPLNQLRAVEDATVIYRLTRAPERRIFYIDVGNLPKVKAEQHLRDMMARHKNRLTYDAATGQIRDDRRIMAMTEDYWLPRRAGGNGTEITTLPGGQNLGQIEDVNYFQKRLYRALNVPVSRLDSETAMFNVGRSSEISRDEIKFSKFIARLRVQFQDLFIQIMGRQVVLKGIMSIEQWEALVPDLKFKFARDNFFAELKDSEIQTARIQLAEAYMPFVGRIVSNDFVRRHVFKQTDEDIKKMDAEIAQEASNPQFQSPEQQAAMGQGPEEPHEDPSGSPDIR